MSLEKEVSEISGLQQQSSDTETKADGEIRKRIEILRKNILNGETTGDKIRDFVIVSHEILSEEAKQPYQQLQERLKNRKGEQILVVNEEIESGGRDGCFGSSRYTSVGSTLRLGVLTSDIIFEIGDGKKDFLMFSLPYSKGDFTGPRIILPTERYSAKIHKKFSTPGWELREGEIQVPYLDFTKFEPDGKRTIPSGMPFGRHEGGANSRRKLLIRVGSEDITDYFTSKRSSCKNDFSYVKALKLLGIEDQAPGEFAIGYSEEIGEEKGYVVRRLIELLEEQGLSKSRIKKIYDIAEKRGVLSERGAITPIEGKDDAFVVSIGSRDKLSKTTRNIKSTLERAVELGMHNEDLIIDGEIPGQSLDARILITTLCKQYEVSYSKN